jgi:hypothetical protein
MLDVDRLLPECPKIPVPFPPDQHITAGALHEAGNEGKRRAFYSVQQHSEKEHPTTATSRLSESGYRSLLQTSGDDSPFHLQPNVYPARSGGKLLRPHTISLNGHSV